MVKDFLNIFLLLSAIFRVITHSPQRTKGAMICVVLPHEQLVELTSLS